MDNSIRRKKAFLLAVIYYFMIYVYAKNNNKVEVEYNDEFSYEDINNNYYASMNDKNIYFINDLSFNKEDNNIYILDERETDDPNIKVFDSYKVLNDSEKKAIINIIEKYNSEDLKEWNRTEKSMFKEWMCHNISYYLNHNKKSSMHVDFNNEDEIKYDKLSRIK